VSGVPLTTEGDVNMSTALRTRLIVVAVVTVAVLVLGVLSASRNPTPSVESSPTPNAATSATLPAATTALSGATPMNDPDIPGLVSYGGLVTEHVNSLVTYAQVPPAGGPHRPVWQNCGVYSERVLNEFAVHSLEHGAVWITYDPALDSGQVARLADITRQSTHRLLSPYPGLPAPIVLSAWGYQLYLPSADDSRLAKFIVRFESGPTTPERGAACSGGVWQTARELGF
jgi:Protein of unknown function (DUF3105)